MEKEDTQGKNKVKIKGQRFIKKGRETKNLIREKAINMHREAG